MRYLYLLVEQFFVDNKVVQCFAHVIFVCEFYVVLGGWDIVLCNHQCSSARFPNFCQLFHCWCVVS